MTLDEYESLPAPMLLQVAMALLQAAQEHIGHKDCDTDISLASIATLVLDDYIQRRDAGPGRYIQSELSQEGIDILTSLLGKLQVVRLQ